MAAKPSVILKCVANNYTGRNERIVEFSHKGQGGLISLRWRGGKLVVDVYRCSEDVVLLSSSKPPIPDSVKQAVKSLHDLIGKTCARDADGDWDMNMPGDASAADVVEELCGVAGIAQEALDALEE